MIELIVPGEAATQAHYLHIQKQISTFFIWNQGHNVQHVCAAGLQTLSIISIQFCRQVHFSEVEMCHLLKAT